MKSRRLYFLIVIIIFFLCHFVGGSYKSSSAIYRDVFNKKLYLSILDPSSSVTITINAGDGEFEGGGNSRTITRTINTELGSIPSPALSGYNFVGWYTAASGGEKVNANTIVTANDDYYAHWVKIVCEKAAPNTLHTEECSTGGGCLKHGYSVGSVIKYGRISVTTDPVAGDAYNCDVNANDEFSSATERFYYVRSINDGLNGGTNKAVLVHYTSFDEAGQMDSSSERNNYTYDAGKAYLPSASLWSNSALITFDGKPSRYIKLDDITEACGGPIVLNDASYISTCQFFMEHSRYQSSSLGRAGIWIEKNNNTLYRIQTSTVAVTAPDDSSSKNTTRPVIEIPYEAIDGYRERVAYTINFNADGGSAVPSKNLYEGQPLGILDSSSKPGYVFDGWYTDSSWTTEATPTTIVTGNITYIAKWNQVGNSLKTIFYIPGRCTFTASGQNTDITSSTNDCISTINPTGVPIDYTATSNRYINTGVGLYTSENHDKDYEISFEIENYDSSVQTANGTLMNTKREASGYPGLVFRVKHDDATKFDLSSRKTSGANESANFDSATTTKVSIYRASEEIFYSINDATAIPLNDLSQYNPTFDTTVWFGAAPTDATGTSAQRYYTGTLKNLIVKIEAHEHTVTFYGEGGTVSPSSSIDVAHGSSIGSSNLPTASKPGYYFDGWYTAASGGTKITGNETIDTDNIEYYAHYKNIYLVTFNTDGGTISFSPSTTEVVSGNTMEVVDGNTISVLPTATKTDMIFDGWYTAENGGGTKYQGNEIISADLTYHANWIESSGDYVIHFASNGGSSVVDMTVHPGDPLNSLPSDPIRNDYTFDGWYVDDNTFTIPVTTSTVPLGETTYYAKWVLDSSYVAQVGSNYYTTLTSAFSAITNSTPTTIIILQDITMTSKITIPSSRDITLNIGNHTITNTSTNVFENNGTLRIHDGVIRDTSGNGAINNNANLYVSGGTIENTSTRQAVYNKGNLYISGTAYLKTDATQRGAIDNDAASATISMTGGTVEATNAGSKTGAIRIVSGSVTITGGTIISNSTATGSSEKGDYAGGIYNKGTLTIGSIDTSHDITTPVIQAKTYAVYSTQNYSFYDGILKGATAVVNDATKITATESGTSPVPGSETISGTTYYTLYYELTNGYKITLNANGGTVNPPTVNIPYGNAVGTSLPTPIKPNHYFNGWYEDSGCTIPVTTSTVPTSDTTYHSNWIKTVALASITNDEIDLLINGTETINVTNNAEIEGYTYSSLNTSIATVNSSGVVTAHAIGVTKIVLTGNLSSEVKYVTVRVNLANDIQTFDIIPAPMRTYFDNISTWAAGQTDSNHSSYDNYMNSNLLNYDCVNFNVDERQTKSSSTGSVYCDLPEHYDTGVNGAVNVYEYDVTNSTIGSAATYVTSNNGKLYNFIPGKAYYWQDANNSSVNGKLYAYGERRIIQIDNLKKGSSDTYFQTRNVRDLGGIPVAYQDSNNVTKTGIIKYGKLYRGEKIWGGEGNSLQYFTKLGINHELDLRGDSEPVTGEEDSFATADKIIKSGSSKTYEIIHYGIDYNSQYMANYTLARNAVIEVMNAFINNSNYSLYFHCRIGADRTGTIAYLLEGLLGVSEEDRYRDYELTVFFGLDERTRFYTNKTTNYVKFVHLKKAIRDAGDGVNEDVVAWFLAGSSNTQADMNLIQQFRAALVDVNP